jgi:phage terminase large subunit-like protein
MTAACGSLYSAIRGGRITHDGDSAFATQVLNAVPRYNEHGFVLSKAKSNPRGKIDAAIALALAFDRLERPEAEVAVEPAVIFGRVR